MFSDSIRRTGTISAGARGLRPFGVLLIAMLATLAAGCVPPRCTTVAAFGNLGVEVNSPYDEYAPALTDTSTLVFTSNRVDPGRGGMQEQYRAVRPAHLYFTMRLSATWDSAQRYSVALGSGDGEGGAITFAPAGSAFGTVAYIGACEGENSIGGCDIYAVTEGTATSMVNLGREINSPSWDGHPFVTPDGSRLYFASDRAGGLGRSDIWISERLPSGAWGAPRNAGAEVNSDGDELSPFFDAASGTLYFSADNGPSGRDIFVVERTGTPRRALTAPYNSDADDFTPTVLNGTLYLSSKRSGGCGGYDLYAFPLR